MSLQHLRSAVADVGIELSILLRFAVGREIGVLVEMRRKTDGSTTIG